MTLQELYTLVDGNYNHAVQIMRMEKLIDRYVRKFPGSNAYDALKAAGETMDPTALFESAHALKGVCANLGFDEMASVAGDITEDYRPGATRSLSDGEIKDRIAKIETLYQRTIAGIEAYVASN